MNRRIKLLGSLVIEEDGRPLRIMNSAKGCGLMAYLIVTGEEQSRQHIADLLWESSSTRQSLMRLRELLGRMRKWLPELQVTRQTVAFEPGKHTAVDIHTLLQGLALLKNREGVDLERVETALELYTGDLLASFFVPGAPHFQEWLLLARERLRVQVLDAYRRLSTALYAAEEWERGVVVARRWLSLEPLDEAAYRYLMRLLADSGQLTAALQTYATCRQVLWQELAVEPEPQTQALAQQLGQQRDETPLPPHLSFADLKVDELSEPGYLPPNAVMPYRRNEDFVGRTATLLQIAKIFTAEVADGYMPVVALTGMGGLGKSQTAVEFCFRYGRYFPGGVFWLRFAEADNVAAEVAAIGSERGMGIYRDAERLSLADRVGRVQRAWQDPIPRLLIFDNCEDEALLRKWLPVTGGCRVLLTSRRAQWSQSLSITQHPLDLLTEAESVALLRRLAPHVSLDAMRKIVQEVMRLPLALFLAGNFLARYRQISPTAYVAQLYTSEFLSHPSLQGHGSAYSPTDHELNVARTFAVSLAQLDQADEIDKTALELLANAACFAAAEPIPRAILLQTLALDAHDLLASLLAADSLERLNSLGFLLVEEGQAVIIHHLLAAFTQSALHNDDRPQTAVINTVATVLTQQLNRYDTLVLLPFASAHLQLITDQALKSGHDGQAQMSWLLGCHLRDQGEYEHARIYLTRALTLFANKFGPAHPETAVCFTSLGELEAQLGNFDAAQQQYEAALTIQKQALGLHQHATTTSLNNLGMLFLRKGELDKAEPYLQQSLTIREQILPPDHIEISISLSNLGILFSRTGQYARAQTCLDAALAMRERTLDQDSQMIGQSLNNLGMLYLRMGIYEKALPLLQRALANRRQTLGPQHRSTAIGLNNLGRLYLLMGRYEQAQQYLQEAATLKAQALGQDHLSTAISTHNLGYCYLQLGDYEKAEALLTQAWSIRKDKLKPGSKYLADSLDYLGQLYTQTADYKRAHSYLCEALEIRTALLGADHPATAECQSNLTELLAKMG